jgi:predicted nuclease of predicted toxin-antitoxin system
MKFLLDQDVYASTARFLTELGHDVVTAARLDLSQASDEELLKESQEQGRIFVTRDRRPAARPDPASYSSLLIG